ncbi:MAG: nuclear transport factor 2 family protein [Acidimicrobiia bacterium]|nr:nuclear transport factor 2 family protein [Acidimicrobiia bacterium]
MGDAAGNDAFITRFLEAWQRRETDVILDCFADDGAYHAMPLPPITGKAALREWVEHFKGVAPARLDVHHQVASGDVVMNERTDHMTLNGRPVTLPICAVFTMADGRIKEWREYFDLGPAKAAFDG